jgi:hypothetical protein
MNWKNIKDWLQEHSFKLKVGIVAIIIALPIAGAIAIASGWEPAFGPQGCMKQKIAQINPFNESADMNSCETTTNKQ